MGAAAPPSSSPDQVPRPALSFLGITMLVWSPRPMRHFDSHVPMQWLSWELKMAILLDCYA